VKNKLNQIQARFDIQGKASGSDETDMYMYGDIGANWWGEGITDKQVLKTLNSIKTNIVNIHINSYGGDVFQGIAISNILKQSEKTVNIYVDGIAASAASIVAMGAEKIYMPKNTQLMIHNPWTYASGNADELEKVVSSLRKAESSIVETYMERFSGTADELKVLLEKEEYLTAEEALLCGLADEILDKAIVEEPVTKNSIIDRLRIAAQVQPLVSGGSGDVREPAETNNTIKNFINLFK